MSQKDRKIIIFILTIFVFVLVGVAIFWQKGTNDSERDVVSEESEEMSQSAISTEEDREQESDAAQVEYPMPDYKFVTEEVTIPIEGVEHEYTFAWVSDLHLISDHEAGELLGDVHVEYLDAIQQRYEELSVTQEGIHAEELWPEIIKYLNYGQFDGVIFGGDMMDYCSNSNVTMIKEGLDNLQIPYIYIRADHDYGTYYGGVFFTEDEARKLHKTIDGDEIAYKFWDRDTFMILGIDNSTKDMPDYYLAMVADVYSRERPVIMVTHVPYESKIDQTLAECSMQVRNKIYYWSDASEQYKPNIITSQYLDMIYHEDTIVEQVLAGHLHESWDGMLTQQVPQHIFAPAFRGTIGIIHIVPQN